MINIIQHPTSLAIGHGDTGPATISGTRMVAVASGKGGVGKTWLSIVLAQSLAMHGRRVLLVDFDLGLANIDVQLGIIPQYDLATVLVGRQSLRDVIVTYSASSQTSGAFDVLPGRSGAASLATLDIAVLDRLLQAIRRLRGYDLVLIDTQVTSAGSGCPER